ncbi:MAG: flagellar export protein FliJ [Bacillota bacterium]
MKFNFKYDKLLSYKKELEDEIKNELAIEIQKLTKLKNKLEDMKKKQKEYLNFIDKEIHKKNKASYLVQINNNKIYFSKEINKIKNEIKNQNKKISKKRNELMLAVQETKKFEKIKEKDFEKFVKEFEDKEVKEIEEIVNYKNFVKSGD